MTKTLAEIIGKRFEVIGDEGWIELVDFMPHSSSGISGDLAIVNAARVSFLGESKGEEKDAKLLRYLMRNKHTSPFEMVEFKFRVRAPVVTWWQWARHRMASYNAQSGRYTPFEEDAMYIPRVDEWRKQALNNKQGSSPETLSLEEQEKIVRDAGFVKVRQLSDMLQLYFNIGFDIYSRILEAGGAKEQARLFLPAWGLYYTWIVKVDAHNLMHFLKLRMDSHAQHEIRVYAQTIYDEIFKVALPVTADAFEEYILQRQT